MLFSLKIGRIRVEHRSNVLAMSLSVLTTLPSADHILKQVYNTVSQQPAIIIAPRRVLFIFKVIE